MPLIVELAEGGEVDRYFQADPPPSLASGRVVLDHFAADADGGLGLPEAGEVVLSVLSPEALTREREQVREVIEGAGPGDEPLVIIVQAAEELREDELAAVIDAASRAPRPVILRVLTNA
jgi:hypothetical protein